MNKQEILNKIEPLFFEWNFKEVSLSKVADILWIKKASLYYYFASKNVFFEEVILNSVERYILFLDSISDKSFDEFIISFMEYPNTSKNLISVIDESYCDIPEIRDLISEKKYFLEKYILNILSSKFWMSETRWFLLLSLISSFSKRMCFRNEECIVSKWEILKEINIIFKS